MRHRLTQREAVFYRLYTAWRAGTKYVPVHEFMGEIFCPEVSKWGYVSYECSARLSEMIAANPELIQREKMRGVSGARYYGYRLNPQATPEMIIEGDLQEFHKRLRRMIIRV